MLFPDYIFESSWEVCNKVGGIYTVLSTRGKTLQDAMHDRIVFVGPDLGQGINAACKGVEANISTYEEGQANISTSEEGQDNALVEDGDSAFISDNDVFIEDNALYSEWRQAAAAEGLTVRVGRWNVPGCPIAVLVDFKPFFERKNEIYAWLWEHYSVDSLHAYGDYDEASMFSYAAGLVVESFYKHNLTDDDRVVYQGNEWMCGLGLLYVKDKLPQVATIFTTHATSIGRSIAGNMKPLYEWLFAYDGDGMAAELNMQSKHSIEKQTAWNVDCFTTVSDITANECRELLGKTVDVVLPNGFDDSFVPDARLFAKKRKAARKKLLDVANALLGEELTDDTLIVSTSGRYEFRNKGIDVFIEALSRLLRDSRMTKRLVAFIEVPAWVAAPRKDLQERLSEGGADGALSSPNITHWLHDMHHDNVLGLLRTLGVENRKEDMVKVIFVPCYLDGNDGIFNMTYYDLVLGNDLCVYPSYYEPWGYTPLEATAFHVPCITTDLAGFGLWAAAETGSEEGDITQGVRVIHRTDNNYYEVADAIKDAVVAFSNMSDKDVDKARRNAGKLSRKALWSEFVKYYYDAYEKALAKAEERRQEYNK